jgi:hypothetical protein
MRTSRTSTNILGLCQQFSLRGPKFGQLAHLIALANFEHTQSFLRRSTTVRPDHQALLAGEQSANRFRAFFGPAQSLDGAVPRLSTLCWVQNKEIGTWVQGHRSASARQPLELEPSPLVRRSWSRGSGRGRPAVDAADSGVRLAGLRRVVPGPAKGESFGHSKRVPDSSLARPRRRVAGRCAADERENVNTDNKRPSQGDPPALEASELRMRRARIPARGNCVRAIEPARLTAVVDQQYWDS